MELQQINKEIENKVNTFNIDRIVLSYCFKIYSIDFYVFISDNDNCFNYSILQITYKNKENAIKMFNLIKNKYPKLNYKVFI